MAQTPAHVLRLNRHTPVRTIDAAVYFAVAIGDELTGNWPARFHRVMQPGNQRFLLGQNSCYAPAKLQVRPSEDNPFFEVGATYRSIEVAWCPSWPRMECVGHRHGHMPRAETIQKLATRIKKLLAMPI